MPAERSVDSGGLSAEGELNFCILGAPLPGKQAARSKGGRESNVTDVYRKKSVSHTDSRF